MGALAMDVDVIQATAKPTATTLTAWQLCAIETGLRKLRDRGEIHAEHAEAVLDLLDGTDTVIVVRD